MRGEMSLTAPLIACRHGRACLGPIKARRNQTGGRHEDLPPNAAADTTVVVWPPSECPPRAIQPRHATPADAYAGESGPGHLGDVSSDRGVTTFTHRRTPRRLRMGPCNLGFRLRSNGGAFGPRGDYPQSPKNAPFSGAHPCVTALDTGHMDAPAVKAFVYSSWGLAAE